MDRRRFARSVMYLVALTGGVVVAHWTAPSGITTGGRDPASQPAAPRRAANAAAVPGWVPLSPDVAHATESVEPRADSPEPSLPAAARHARLRDGLVIDGSTPHRLILFTFDDGPERRTTPLLLDRLDAVGVKAVFFLTSSRIDDATPAEREQAAIAREIVARGHLIGNHTVDHLQLPLLDDAGMREQVIGAEDSLLRVLGMRPTLFRPPGGARSPRVDEFLASRGYTTVLWNLGSGDFQVHTAQEVLDTFRKVMERREREDGERGGIVLMHDTYAWSVDAFQLIWAELSARNCALLARGEELYDVVPDLSYFHQPRGAAPAGFIAPAAQPPADVLAERQARLRVDAAQRCRSIDGF
jgi:peptidoglycan-N-acetylglucosamine deacetylase